MDALVILAGSLCKECILTRIIKVVAHIRLSAKK
jgi:hypothetical protein